MGIASDVLSMFARKPIFGYHAMAFSMIGIAFLSWIVWGHHMFQSGMNPMLGMSFMLTTMVIGVPSAIKTFNWLGTLWGGRIQFTTPMLFALGFVSMFVIGGLSGIYMASTPVDIYIHDTYYIVAHIHYVVFGGSIFGIFAGLYYWFPKMFGRMMNETLGKIHFWLTLIFFNVTFFPMHIIGVGGHMRRIYNPTQYEFLKPHPALERHHHDRRALPRRVAARLRRSTSSGASSPGSARRSNPWHANTLEWEAPSPPPHGNFPGALPTVYRGPYEYSSPLVSEDYLPQARRLEPPVAAPPPRRTDTWPIRSSSGVRPARGAPWRIAVPPAAGGLPRAHQATGGDDGAGHDARRLLPRRRRHAAVASLLLHTLLGTALAAAGTLALNQYMERDLDGRMERTRHRPLPRRPPGARARRWLLGLALLVGGLAYLGGRRERPVPPWSPPPSPSTTCCSTRRSSRCTSLCSLVGAVPGALPPVAGWAAARGGISASRRGSCSRSCTSGRSPTPSRSAACTATTTRAPASASCPSSTRDGSSTAIAGGRQLPRAPARRAAADLARHGRHASTSPPRSLLGLGFLWAAIGLARTRSLVDARRLLFVSLVYLPVLLGTMALDKLPLAR